MGLLSTILSTKPSSEIQLFCGNVKSLYPKLAANPKIQIEEKTDENGQVIYGLSINEIKSYSELFPGTDISQRISKMVKDLKDSYVYLKPGIKMCDKLMDFIKTLKFNVTTPVIANDNPTNDGDETGTGNGTPKDPDPTPKDPKLEELKRVLDEIRNELVKLASLIDKLNKNPNDENMKKEISESYDKCGKDLDKAQGIVAGNKDNENIQKLQPDVDTLRGQWFNLGKTLSAQVTIGLGQGQPGPDGTPTYVLQNSMLAFWAMVSGNAQILSDIRGYNNLSTLFAAPQIMTVESYVTIENVSYKVAVDVNIPRETKGETNRFSNSISTLIKSIVEKTGSVDMVAIHQGLVEAFNTSNVNDEFYGFSVNGEVKIEDLSKRTAKVNTGSTVVGPAKGEHEVEKTSEIITPTTGAQQPVASDKNRFTVTFDGKNVILLDNGKKISERPGTEQELASLETALKTANASALNHQQALIEQFMRNNGMQPIEMNPIDKEMGDD